MKGDQNEFPISHYWLSFLLFLAGCSWDEGASAEPSDPVNGEQEPPVIAEVDPLSAQAPVSNPIDVTGPITLSRNPLFHLTGRDEYLSVVQVSGGYSEDWSPGAAMGRTWDGEFLLQKSSLELNPYFHDDVTFHSFFDIEFDDYNGDGDLDFTIGQYATSNGNIYQLFTIEQNGNIKTVKQTFIWNGEAFVEAPHADE